MRKFKNGSPFLLVYIKERNNIAVGSPKKNNTAGELSHWLSWQPAPNKIKTSTSKIQLRTAHKQPFLELLSNFVSPLYGNIEPIKSTK